MGDWIIECCFHFFLSLVLPGRNMMRQTGRPGLGSGWGSCPHSCCSVSSFLSFFLPGSFIILGWGWGTTEGGRAPLFLFLAGAWDLHTEWVVFTLYHRKCPSPSWAQNCGGALPISLSPLTSPRKARQGAAGWVRGEEKLMEMPSGLWRNLRCLGKRLCAWTLAPPETLGPLAFQWWGSQLILRPESGEGPDRSGLCREGCALRGRWKSRAFCFVDANLEARRNIFKRSLASHFLYVSGFKKSVYIVDFVPQRFLWKSPSLQQNWKDFTVNT